MTSPTPEELIAKLTPRELDIARLQAQGFSARYIAERYTVSTRTVESQVRTLRAKLLVKTRDALIAAYADLLLDGSDIDRLAADTIARLFAPRPAPKLSVGLDPARPAPPIPPIPPLPSAILAGEHVPPCPLAYPGNWYDGRPIAKCSSGPRCATMCGVTNVTNVNVGPPLHIASRGRGDAKTLCGVVNPTHVTDGARYADCRQCLALHEARA